MQWLFKWKVEMHGPRPVVRLVPGLLGKLQQLRRGCRIQADVWATRTPTADGLEELLLIHRLIGTAVLEADGAIGG